MSFQALVATRVATADRPRTLSMDGSRNTRDLGGYATTDGRTTAWGRLLRSDELQDLTPADRERLADLGLAVIVDLRTAVERSANPTPPMAGVGDLHLPVYETVGHHERIDAALADLDAPDTEAPLVTLNREMVTSQRARTAYAELVDHVVETLAGGRALLFHCVAGKDRTGLAAAIVLAAVGVDEATILADYLITGDNLAGYVDELVAEIPDPQAAQATRAMWLTDPAYLRAAFAQMRADYGSVDAYLEHGLGIDAGKREALRDALLT